MKEPLSVAHDLSSPAATAVVNDEDVARRAYEIYMERGYEPGRELDHWLQAEQELRSTARR